MPDTLFNPTEAAAVKRSFSDLVPKSDEFAASLYRHLFRLAPSVRSLFRPDMDEQYYKLVRMISTMVEAADDPERFEADCRASGARHRKYGAKPAHYPVLREALVAALRETASPSPEEEALWLRLYDQAARLMVGAE